MAATSFSVAHAYSASVPLHAPKTSSPGWNRFAFAPTASTRPAASHRTRVGRGSSSGTARWRGWWVYGIGLLLYLGSYLAQVFLPHSCWSRSAVGFAAPAWTTAFWLVGIGLVTRPWPTWPWVRAAYRGTAAAFVVVHTTHAFQAFAAP